MSADLCLDENQVLDLLEGRLSRETMAHIQTHADGCADCYALLTQAAVVHAPEAAANPAATPSLAPAKTFPSSGPQPAPLTSGQHVGPYVIIRPIGAGGMGIVYEARHERIGHRAALKVLTGEYAARTEVAARLLTEARAANLVQHPSLVRVFDDGYLPEGAPFLAMEYLDGSALSERLVASANRLSLLPFLQQAADALSVCHEHGIIHRDLKPDNLMVVKDPVVPSGERVKILDFGLAKVITPFAESSNPTARGVILGTPLYMAPEQGRDAGRVDAQADVYSLGVILYEVLAGHPPFQSTKALDVITMHLRDQPAPLVDVAKQAPAALSALAHRMLDKSPQARPTMKEVAAQLLRFSTGDQSVDLAPLPRARVESKRRLPILAVPAASILLILAMGLGWSWRKHRLVSQDISPVQRIHLPGGTFTMGSSSSEIDAAYVWCQRFGGAGCTKEQFFREYPPHEVAISDYLLDATEVDYAHFAVWLNQLSNLRIDTEKSLVRLGDTLLVDYYAMYGHGGLAYTGGKFAALRGFARRPVTQVTWDAAAQYCKAQGMRLPTEAEWEYAARSGQALRFPWGFDEPRCDGVVFARNAGWSCGHLGPASADVGTSAQDRSLHGVLDLAGNVSEWVQDRFLPGYPPCPTPCKDPVNEAQPDSGLDYRIVRGGDWFTQEVTCRATFRSRVPHDRTAANIGFRCARSLGSR